MEKLKKYLYKRKIRKFLLKEERWKDYFYKRRDDKELEYIFKDCPYPFIIFNVYRSIINKYKSDIFLSEFSGLQNQYMQQNSLRAINLLFNDNDEYILKLIKKP